MSGRESGKRRDAPAAAAGGVQRRESGDRSFGDRAAGTLHKQGPGPADDQDVVVAETYDATTEASGTGTAPRKPRNAGKHTDAPTDDRPDTGSPSRHRR